MVHATLSSAKTLLRAEMRALRRSLAERAPDAADRAAGHLPLHRLPPFTIIAGYHPHGGEISPAAVLARLAGKGCRVVLPVANIRDEPMVFREAVDPAHLAPDVFGIPAPPRDAPQAYPDIVIAPLIAFDRKGGRLGQGAGAYDRTLAALRQVKPIFVIGLAYADQEVARVPSEPHDFKLDAILTEKGYIEVN